jgi:hypothetical protein
VTLAAERAALARRARLEAWCVEPDPFPHAVVSDVFRGPTYARLVRGYRDVFARGLVESAALEGRFCRGPGSRGPYSYVVRPSDRAFDVFFGRAWHDHVTALFGVRGDRRLSIALHYVPPRTARGRPHNDLNPGWFPRARPPRGGVIVHDPGRSSYPSGKSFVGGVTTTASVRAVAMLFYLDNDGWRPSWGGGTALYRLGDAETAPSRVVAPRSNSLVAFPCQPRSYHALFGTGPRARRSIAMWLHRPRREAEEEFGSGAIVPWT